MLRSGYKGLRVIYRGQVYRLDRKLSKGDGNAVLRGLVTPGRWLHVSPHDLEPYVEARAA